MQPNQASNVQWAVQPTRLCAHAIQDILEPGHNAFHAAAMELALARVPPDTPDTALHVALAKRATSMQTKPAPAQLAPVRIRYSARVTPDTMVLGRRAVHAKYVVFTRQRPELVLPGP